MSAQYREFDDFASTNFPTHGMATIEQILQEIAQNIQLFANNVTTIERRIDLLHTTQDTPRQREEIIHLVRDTAQLAKYADASIRKLKQGRRLSPAEKMQFDRLMSTFSASGTKFQNLQKTTADLEQDMLTKARSRRTESFSSYTETEKEDVHLMTHESTSHSEMMEVQQFAQIEQDAAIVEERERDMRQLEHDITDINEIFRDLGTLVYEQGEVVDNIEANVEVAGTRVEQGNKQLDKAVGYKRCSRKLSLCILCIVTTVVIIIIVVVLVALKIFTPVFDK